MRARYAAAILIEFAFLLTASHAQQPNSIFDPEAERILDKASQAEGGDNVLRTLRTLRMKGTMYSGTSSHILGDVESIVKLPDKFLDMFDSANGNNEKHGFDGTVAWNRLVLGERSTGLPKFQLLLPAAQWRLRYTEASFVGRRKIGKHQAYVIRAIIHGQISPADYYYDAVSYLLLQIDATASGAPPIPVTYRVTGFHDLAGLVVPREWSFDDNRTVITSIRVNIDIDDNQFVKPK